MIIQFPRRTALIAALIGSVSSSAAAQSDAAFAAALGNIPSGIETLSLLKTRPQKLVLAAATAAAPGRLPVIRTNTGLRYELPAGWEWGGFDGNSVTIQHVATKVGNASPNVFSIGVTPTYGNDYAAGWDRIDRDQQRTYPGGVSARWRAGVRYGLHYYFIGEATIGSKALSVAIVTKRTPLLDISLVEAAFASIVETLKDVPATPTLHHPTLAIAADALPSKSWYFAPDYKNMKFRCWNNGRYGNAWIYAYPAAAEFTNAGMVMADITGYIAGLGVTIGAVQSAAIAGGEVLWTEQPGSPWPFLGALRRDGRYYGLALNTNGPGSCTQDPALEDFMAVAKSLRVWDGN